MKVRDLIELLEGCDDDAEVILGIQPSYPFEHGVRGVVQRQDFVDYDETDHFDEDGEPIDQWRDSFTTKGKPNDVIICEGGQIRYGNRDMFDACSGW